MAQKQEHYLVKWEIDIYSDSPKEAAIEALKIMRDKDSEALIFDVHHTKSNGTYSLDLMSEVYSNLNKIEYIQNVIKEYGDFSTYDVEADTSPCINQLGETLLIIERFYLHKVEAVTYIGSREETNEYLKYEDLDPEIITEILVLAKTWKEQEIERLCN